MKNDVGVMSEQQTADDDRALDRDELNQFAHDVVGAAYEVSNELGAGFFEKVYEKALERELGLRGHVAITQAPIKVFYKQELVGEYFADLLVDGKLIVELKCVDEFSDEHLAQTLNYLKATGYRLALQINFKHPKVEWRRVVRNL